MADTAAAAGTLQGPDVRYDFEPGQAVTDVAVLPDGVTAYAAQPDWAIDLGMFLRWHSPYLLAPVALAIVATLVWRAHKLWRQRHYARGSLHCAKCGYSLHGLVNPTCPECGAITAGRGTLRARPVRGRLAVLGVACLAVVAGWAMLWPWPVRSALAGGPTGWRSSGLLEWAQRNSVHWLSAWGTTRTDLLRLDLARGGAPSLAHRDEYTFTMFAGYSDDTHRLYRWDAWGGVSVMDRHLTELGGAWGDEPWLASLYSPTFDETHIAALDRNGRLILRPISYHGQDEIIPLERFYNVPLTQPIAPERRIYIGFESDSVLRAWHNRRHLKRWDVPSGRLLNEFQLTSGEGFCFASSRVDGDPLIYVNTLNAATGLINPIEIWHAETGVQLGQVVGPLGEVFAAFDVSPNGRYLYGVPSQERKARILVQDLFAGSWVQALDASGVGDVWRLIASFDGTRVLALGSDSDEGGHLYVYDVPELADAVPDAEVASLPTP